MIVFYNVILIFIGSITPVFACFNMLPYPIKNFPKAIILLYVFYIYYFLGDKLGQLITPLGIGGILLFVVIFNRRKALMNGICALIGYLCAVVMNHLTFIALSFLGISLPTVQNKYPLAFSVIFFALVFGITFCLGQNLRKNVYRIEEVTLPRIIVCLLLVELCACVLIFVFNIINAERLGYTDTVIRFNALLFFTFFFITFIITVFIVQSYEKEKRVTSKLKEFEAMQEYTRKIEEMYMDLRSFKHDYFNILSSIRLYMEEGNMEGLKDYFEKEILPAGEELSLKNSVLGALSYLEVKEVKGLIYTKLFYALKEEIDLTLDIREVIGEIGMDTLDLIRILGIFLDNAVEAAKESLDKKVYVGFAKKETAVLIVIKNTFAQDSIDLKEIYKFSYSTKGEHRGVGLYQVGKILGKYENVVHETKIENGMFCQNLEIIL